MFVVKGLLSVAQNVRSTILLNLLSYMSDKLLTEGNTVAALDELYIWLSNPVAIEYIRNSLKRVRKKESALVLASQNLEDFDQPGVREMTKPLFSDVYKRQEEYRLDEMLPMMGLKIGKRCIILISRSVNCLLYTS